MRVGQTTNLCHAQIWIVGRVTIRSFASGSAFGVTIFIVRSGGSLSARPRHATALGLRHRPSYAPRSRTDRTRASHRPSPPRWRKSVNFPPRSSHSRTRRGAAALPAPHARSETVPRPWPWPERPPVPPVTPQAKERQSSPFDPPFAPRRHPRAGRGFRTHV